MGILLKNIIERRKQQSFLSLVHKNMRKNLELFHVMDQQRRFRPFVLEAVLGLNDGQKEALGAEVISCIDKMNDFNEALKDSEKYEHWYSADIDRKTKENARILHDKKERVEKEFEGFEEIIKRAVKRIEERLR